MRKAKGAIITLAIIAALAAGGIFSWQFIRQNRTEPVKVYSMDFVGMTEFWGDTRESYGPVSSDRIQTVFLSDTQTVAEILVQEGQQVRKGDLLMSFDTTLSQLELERKDLQIQKTRLDLEEAENHLREISWMQPMGSPPTEPETEPTEPDLGWTLGDRYYAYLGWGRNGTSPSDAFVCWVRNDTVISDRLLIKAIGRDLMAYLQLEEEEEEEDPTEETTPEEEDPTEETQEPTEEETPTEETQDPTEETQEPTEETTEESQPSEEPEETDPPETEQETESLTGEEELVFYSDMEEEEEPEDEEPAEEPSDGDEDTDTDEDSRHHGHHREPVSYYMILKMTDGNLSKAETILWIGVHVHKDGSFTFFDARNIADYTLPKEEEPETEPYVDWFGSGYTYAEIQRMKEEQIRKIRELELALRMAEAEYKIMERELSDGNIYAEIDGTVLSVLDEEEAKLKQLPVVKLSGGGGFYVEASVNELERDSLELGQEVTINDWETGMSYTGTVTAIGDIPTQSGGYNGMDNPNASSYPFTVFVEEDADLKTGSYVSVQYAAASGQQGVYLQLPFVRTVQGRSFVYVRGEDGLLEERDVTTGKSLWGSYMEIVEGLSQDDLVAFPYGKNVRPGVPAEEGNMNDLYGY